MIRIPGREIQLLPITATMTRITSNNTDYTDYGNDTSDDTDYSGGDD